MKKRMFGIVSVIIIFLMASVYCFTQAPGGPGGRPGGAAGGRQSGGPPAEMMMIMQTLPIDSSWGYVSFELGVSDGALVKARKAYKEAYDQRKDKIMSKMEAASGDAAALRNLKAEADKIRATLDAKLKTILTPEQMTKLTNWLKESSSRMRRAPGGPSGAPRSGQQK